MGDTKGKTGIKTVILAGGLGTRLGERAKLVPKPMVTIGEHPILWHILSLYCAQGFGEFIIALGYKGGVIRRYVESIGERVQGDTFDIPLPMRSGPAQRCRVVLADTGRETMTGGRLLRLRPLLGSSSFMVTYGDGLSDVDIRALLRFHRGHGAVASLTAVHPPPRFGRLTLDGPRVTTFREKPSTGNGWINGGFFVFEPGIFQHIQGDETILEAGPLSNLAAAGSLMAYQHPGFWACMDTPQDVDRLNALWASKSPPWIRPARAEAPPA